LGSPSGVRSGYSACSRAGCLRWKGCCLARQLLGKLNVYYRDVTAETGRFTKDAALLAEVQRITNERMELILDLLLALEM
jgi:hypothetical protein